VLQVTFCREADAEAARLNKYLINEPLLKAALDEAEATEANTLGYEDWLAFVQDEVARKLNRTSGVV
jgi:hypothetical protein